MLNTREKCILFACDATTVILEFLLMNWDVVESVLKFYG